MRSMRSMRSMRGGLFSAVEGPRTGDKGIFQQKSVKSWFATDIASVTVTVTVTVMVYLF